MKRVFVCSGMNIANNDNINKQARQLGLILADLKYTYIQGGSSQGLMGLTLVEF